MKGPDYEELVGRTDMPKTKPKSKLPAEREEFLLHPPEIAVFMACCVVVNELRGLERTFKAGEITEGLFQERAANLFPKLIKAAGGAECFDVVMPVVGETEVSSVFWRWFNWWEDYFSGLNPTEICEIERLGKELKLAVNDYRPKEHWLTFRPTAGVSDCQVASTANCKLKDSG